MASAIEMEQVLRLRYALETELSHLLQWQNRLETALPQKKHEAREAHTALVEYENSGLSGLMDRLSGKREEKLEQLRQAERRMAMSLQTHIREQQELADQITGTHKTLAELREKEEAQKPDWTPGITALKARLEALLWAGRLLPLLDQNQEALLEARNWARSGNLEFGKNREVELGKALSYADDLAKRCYEAMERIAATGILLEIPPYFENPAGYICATTQFTRMDRINRALDAVADTLIQAQTLLSRLQREEI